MKFVETKNPPEYLPMSLKLITESIRCRVLGSQDQDHYSVQSRLFHQLEYSIQNGYLYQKYKSLKNVKNEKCTL